MASPAGPERISKLLARRGLCSRREADEYIRRGWVLLDGKPVSELGTRALPHQRLELDPRASRAQEEAATVILNKPVGYVAGTPEPGKQPAIMLVRPENQAGGPRLPPAALRGLAPAGRLDIDSKGLMVFTADGRVARRLVGENSTVEKEYLVRVEGNLPEEGLARLRHGLALDGRPLKPALVEWVNADQLRFVLLEGRKRQIRRMCDAVGLKVLGLKRVRIGRVHLGGLPEGRWRPLSPGEEF